MKIPITQDEQIKFLTSIITKITDRKLESSAYSEGVSIEIQFENSPEGLTIGVDNASSLSKHIFINPWVYEDMMPEEIQDMKRLVNEALELFPQAVLFFEDDGSFDYNPNSIVDYKDDLYYIIKSTDSNEWKRHFEIN